VDREIGLGEAIAPMTPIERDLAKPVPLWVGSYGWGCRGLAKPLPLPYMKGLKGNDFVPAELKLTDLANGTGM